MTILRFNRAWIAALALCAFVACKSSDKPAADSKKGTSSTSSSTTPSTDGKEKSEGTTEAATSSGHTIKDDLGKFTIQLPDGFSEPEKGSTKVPSAIGELTMHSYTSMHGDDKVCMVGYSEYPPVAFSGQSMKTMYDNARDGAVKNSGGTLDKEEDITVDGQPGRRIYVSMNKQGQEMHSRFEYVAHKPCLIFYAMVAKTQSDLNTPEAEGYFGSMKFNK